MDGVKVSSKEIFGRIYSNEIWGDGSAKSPLSGGGSLAENAQTYVEFVRDFISGAKITTVVDFGHGDWEMWKKYQFEGTSYIGVDIAENLSNKVKEKYGNANRIFMELDLVKSNLPSGDLLISKDVLQHLSNSEVEFFLSKLSNFKYLILCNDIFINRNILNYLRDTISLKKRLKLFFKCEVPKIPKRPRNNSEVEIGEFRGIDLQGSPFLDHFSNLTLEKILDYDGPRRSGIKERIYLFSK